MVEQVEDNKIPEVTRWTTTEPTETWEITTTSSTTISTTPSTTTTTTTPPRKCPFAVNNNLVYLQIFFPFQAVNNYINWSSNRQLK